MIPKFKERDTYEKEMLENVTPLFDDSNSMMAIITDFQIKGSPGTSEIEIGSYDTTFNWDEFPYVIMQSTGLKDKNGVEIFEGDIGWDDHLEVHGQVIFENGAFKYEWDNISEDLFEVTDDIEIVGNIYENSELLEGSE
ncbi:hypothetical protein ELZ29_07195 [Enterococcus faecalis]|uniref:YopX family protein n=1 Tax=Enterococcus TaxID=1350 RepID=UPI0019F0A6F7|nr:hypothetical protein [Enterococcus faecalis]EGO6772385.1 hypothetical protein [Enterococcus faecalis]EGO8516621.1 hypothetical protein [Enterococcus faecalis]EGO9486580.1 hypothetical protein [Enterococcus faecalis]EHK0894420.1 hypothetical protein [Enterococcus faecalis]